MNNGGRLEQLSVAFPTNNNVIGMNNTVKGLNGVTVAAKNAISAPHNPGESGQIEVQQFGSESEARSKHHHLAVSELSASFDGLFCPNKNDAIAHQRLYEAQRDLSPLYQKPPNCCTQSQNTNLSGQHGKSAQSCGTGLDHNQVREAYENQ